MKKMLKIILHRLAIVIFLLALQVLALVTMILRFNNYFVYFYAVCILISLLVLLHVINNKSNPSYKIAWIIPILIFPIFGGLFYILFGGNKISNHTRKKMRMIKTKMESINFDEKVIENLKTEDLVAYKQANYIQKHSKLSLYNNTYSEYYQIGEDYFNSLKKELLKAKHYIFLEFFIVEEGYMWNSILDILVQKVKEGVDVRLMYDDMGCIMTLPYKYSKKLESLGIKTCVFNPFIPVLSSRINNRNHRKIVVIDGYTGFTGGINLADEYINIYPKYGHWKDSGIMLRGGAVWNLTIMFLSMWDYTRGIDEDYKDYFPEKYLEEKIKDKGYILPYSDSPLDDECIGENVYLNMINNANKYIYIMTPYLIIDNEMVTALTLACKSGVDVKILTPGIPDKKLVNEVTKSYYENLIESGVKIYEYTPGFVHSKNFVVDDKYATVGTINLDYRSLYLHFECGTWLYDVPTIKDIKKDFEQTLEVSKQINLEECQKVKKLRKLLRAVLKIFAPLL